MGQFLINKINSVFLRYSHCFVHSFHFLNLSASNKLRELEVCGNPTMKCRVDAISAGRFQIIRPWHSRINGRTVRPFARSLDEDEEGENGEEEDNGRGRATKGTFPRDKIRPTYRRRSAILVWWLVEGPCNRRICDARHDRYLTRTSIRH